MPGKGIRTYEGSAADNVALGQGGATVVADVATHTALNGAFVAITFLTDTTFQALTAESADFFGYATAASNVESSDATLDNANGVTFPKGTTIFGRWSSFQLASSTAVIAYRG